MKWEKLGRIFVAQNQRPWIVSHGSVPTPEPIRDDLFRIYFSPRDQKGRSNVSYLVIDIKEPQRILDFCEKPCLEAGSIGAFDDSGAMFSWIVKRGTARWLYYIGWNVGTVTPWRTAIGLAICNDETDGLVFERYATGPIMDRCQQDPYFVTNPYVLVEGTLWRMWYLSGIGWKAGTPALPRYHVCYAQSSNGTDWVPTGRVCIPHAHTGEVAIGRPCVLEDGGIYRMWYSFRGDDFGYKIGYAESPDGLTWTRMDHLAGMSHSNEGWDSDATAYPTVFDHRGRRYMLYCGNGYSKAGFGLAVLVS